jgi:protein involved in polysaccharide export with SLBB domain/capsular polysaccharide biosynthesis protein
MNHHPEDTIAEAPPSNGTRSMPYRGARRWNPQHPPRTETQPFLLPGGGGARNSGFAVDTWSLLDPLLRRWKWPFAAALLLLILGGLFAATRWHTTYTSNVQLVYHAPTGPENGYRPRHLVMPTLAGLLRAPELLRRVGAYAQPALTPNEVNSRLRITPERESEIVNITVTGDNLTATVNLANTFAREAVRFTQELQARDAAETAGAATARLKQIETDLAVVEKRLAALPPTALAPVAAATPIANPAADKLAAAHDELASLLARYTDAHPLVRQQRALITALEQQAKAAAPAGALAANTGSSAAAPALQPGDDLELLRAQARDLGSTRAQLINQQRTAALVQENPPGYLEVLVRAEPETAVAKKPNIQIGVFALFLGLVGLIGTAATMVGREFLDNRLKTASDVRRVAHLPLIASLGNTDDMTEAQKSQWAFRTWTALQRRLSVSPNHGLVCGITSAEAGEGRSTWIKLLAQAAAERGFRVLTITTQPGGPATAVDAEVVSPEGQNTATIMVADHTPLLTTSALATPALITDQLQRADAPPRIDIPLPGWVWSLERRKQWAEALHTWRKVDNLVILVELPPANIPEAVLLAENIPNLVWLSESGHSDAAETRQQLETLRQARCNLVGAVLNRESAPPMRRRFTRWLGCGAALLGALAFAPDASAQGATVPVQTSSSFIANNPAERAEWQKKLTLGPGDVLTIGIYGEPALLREEIAIGPDGNVSFLEARGVKAAGLTIDELRTKLDQELGQFRRNPRTIVTPVAYRSKNYVVLGKVARRGLYPLDRPVTIVEAVARAGGFETTLRGRSIVDSADFSRAFLVRGDQRINVDFDKLFRSGDLTQNVVLAPGDYLYFPAAGLQEVYVLGEVRYPGAHGFTSATPTSLAAIAGRGGFTDQAWKGRVLVVRGSLERPETFVVDTSDILSGRAKDLTLQPRDIVYVSRRPWVRAEELLDIAASSFVQSAILNWTGLKTGPVIK